MRKITLLFFLLITSLSFSQVTIGTGNDGSSTNSPPISPFYGFSYSQSIYLASEIGASGNITSIDFALNSGASISTADEMVDVWIGHTTKSAFDTTSDWVDVSTLTQVLTNGTITASGDVLTITFSTPFTYNGTDNLIIAVDANESGFGSSSDYVLSTNGPTAGMSLDHRSDSTNSDPASPETGILRQNRGNITFNGITQTCPVPTNVTATPTSTTDVDITWTAGGTETNWSYEYGVTGFTQGSGTSGTTTASSLNLTNLTEGETYDIYVQANCGGGDDSTFATATWTQPLPPPANDDCSGAISLTVNTDLDCTNVTVGTIAGATDSGVTNNGAGTPNDDVWFSFVATNTTHFFSMENVAGSYTDLVHEVLDGSCGSLTSLNVSDNNDSSVSNLTIGNTYYVRVFGYSSTAGRDTTFDVCVGTPPPPPVNDDCANATAVGSLPFNETLDATGATNNESFITSCSNGMNDGVWYTFTTVDAGTIDIAITGVTGWDAEVALFSGSCGTLICVDRADSETTGGDETLSGVSVDANTQYWINIGYWSVSNDGSEGPFTIDITTADTTTVLKVESNSIENFTLFPTIVKDKLSFNSQERVDVLTVYNIMGQEVLSKKLAATNASINVSSLSNGMYIVKVKAGNSLGSYKIIKE